MFEKRNWEVQQRTPPYPSLEILDQLVPVTLISLSVIFRAGLFVEGSAERVCLHRFWTFIFPFCLLNMSKRVGEGDKQNDAKKSNPQLGDAINMTKWIEENKSSFLPPVCNKMM